MKYRIWTNSNRCGRFCAIGVVLYVPVIKMDFAAFLEAPEQCLNVVVFRDKGY